MVAVAYGIGRLRELSITKFKSQFKRGFTKVVVTRAGRLRDGSERELRLYYWILIYVYIDYYSGAPARAKRAWDRAPYSWNMVNLFSFGCHVTDRAYVRTSVRSGRKNVLRKLLRIRYRRLKAGFSIC